MRKAFGLALVVLLGLYVLANAAELTTSNVRTGDAPPPAPRFFQCEVECPPDAMLEGEPDCYDGYIDSYNGGCNSNPYVFQMIDPTVGLITICGKSGVFDDYYTRDTDWFQITLAGEADLKFCCTAEFPVLLFVLPAPCPAWPPLALVTAPECQEACIEITLGAGTYYLWVGPSDWLQIPCGSDYVMTVSLPRYCSFPCWDWSGDCLRDPNMEISTVPACLRDWYFNDAFPTGLTVGADGPGLHKVTWTSPAAVEAFACGYGLPAALGHDYVDPASNQLGSIYGEVMALRLNREFSCGGYFTENSRCYGAARVPPEMIKFAGLTVDQLLAVADQALGGNASALIPYGNSLIRLQSAVALMNEMYDDCGRLVVPRPIEEQVDDDESGPEAGKPLPAQVAVTSHPNPLETAVTIQLALPATANVSMEIYDVQGRRVVTMASRPMEEGYHDVTWNGADDSGAPVASGVYFLKVQVDGRAAAMHKLTKL